MMAAKLKPGATIYWKVNHEEDYRKNSQISIINENFAILT